MQAEVHGILAQMLACCPTDPLKVVIELFASRENLNAKSDARARRQRLRRLKGHSGM